jgi:hypothetical protein
MKDAIEKFVKFQRLIDQLALMTDTLKIQQILSSEYGMRLSLNEVRTLQGYPPKLFTFRVIDLWASNQPHEALAWAASISWPNGIGVDLLELFIDAARKTLPNLNRDMLDEMLPEGPGKTKALDLVEAATDPNSLASRILAVTNPAERVSRLRSLAQGWSDPETAAEWARQYLSGANKAVFYSQVGYWLAEQNPQAALAILAELKGEIIDVKSYGIDPQSALQVWAELDGAGAYAFTLGAMMRGLAQVNGYGQQVAELIANLDLSARLRSKLISDLARFWVRHDADAAVAWANTLTAPEDIRAAIPLLVSQLDHDQVSRWVEANLENPDPVMELALIEAAAPDLYFNPRKSRLILDPIISKDPGLRLRSSRGYGSDGQSDLRELIARRAHEIYEQRGRRDGEDLNDWLRAEAEVKSSVMAEKRRAIERRGANKEEILWRSVNLTAKRLAEVDTPEAAMEWLAALPFASQSDYANAATAVLMVWNLKSPTEAADWLRNSTLDAALKSVLQKIAQPEH